MDENPINPGENKPEAEPIVAPDEIKETPTDSVVTPEAEPMATAGPVAEPVAPEPTAVAPEPVTPEPAGVPTQPVMEPMPEKKSHAGIIILAIVAIALVVAGVIICLILLNGADKKPAPENPETPTEQPVENPTGNNKTSTVSCASSGDTWSYSASIELDNESRDVTKLSSSLNVSGDYLAKGVTDEEAGFLDEMFDYFSSFDGKEWEGVTIINEGDIAAGEDFSGSIEIDRSKVTDETLLKSFTNHDDLTAEEILNETQGPNIYGINMVCEIK